VTVMPKLLVSSCNLPLDSSQTCGMARRVGI
jgi:hypothetical protein